MYGGVNSWVLTPSPANSHRYRSVTCAALADCIWNGVACSVLSGSRSVTAITSVVRLSTPRHGRVVFDSHQGVTLFGRTGSLRGCQWQTGSISLKLTALDARTWGLCACPLIRSKMVVGFVAFVPASVANFFVQWQLFPHSVIICCAWGNFWTKTSLQSIPRKSSGYFLPCL